MIFKYVAQSVSDLAASTASELLEEYYSNYDDSSRGIDLETISHAVMKAKYKLIEDGLLQKDFSSAENMLEESPSSQLINVWADLSYFSSGL
jgi:hypothetical protein